MAAADATLPTPAPAPARRILARLARSRFAAAAVDAVNCSFLASLWVHSGAGVAAAVAKFACGGDDCRATDVALQVMSVARISFMLVFPVSIALLLLLVLGLSSSNSGTKLEEEKPPALRRIASVAWELLRGCDACDPVMIGLLVSLAFILLMLAGGLLMEYSPMKSRKDRIGTLIFDLGFLALNALNFFFLHPIVALRAWRLRREIRPRLCYSSAV